MPSDSRGSSLWRALRPFRWRPSGLAAYVRMSTDHQNTPPKINSTRFVEQYSRSLSRTPRCKCGAAIIMIFTERGWKSRVRVVTLKYAGKSFVIGFGLGKHDRGMAQKSGPRSEPLLLVTYRCRSFGRVALWDFYHPCRLPGSAGPVLGRRLVAGRASDPALDSAGRIGFGSSCCFLSWEHHDNGSESAHVPKNKNSNSH